EATTRTMLQAVTVLAVNNRLGTSVEKLDGRYRPSVTLAVTPENAQKLTHAVAQGEVTLTLRNDIDVTHVETHGARASKMLMEDRKERRITVKEWTERRESGGNDGTLLLIQGKQVKREKSSNNRR
ncbi:MAG: RcpC/CpaB family pilus assembly protein, partial [Myxococcota bacterium]